MISSLAYPTLFACLAICCGIAALILVSLWAQDTSGSQYLGKPGWFVEDKFPSYHPVLMVGGFHFAQVLGICMWSLIPDHNIAKLLHALFMLASIGTLVAALRAIVRYENYTNIPQLTSMHSWLGVLTVLVFGMQAVGGITLGIMSAARRDSHDATHTGTAADSHHMPILRTIADAHRGMGLIVLALTTITIIAGIQNQLLGPRGSGSFAFQGSCGYNSGENPAEHYSDIPSGCRIALGCGICVVLASIFTALAAYTRSFTFNERSAYVPPPTGVERHTNEMAVVKSNELAVIPNHDGTLNNA